MRWTLKSKIDSSKIEALQKTLNVDAVTAALLLERNIQTFDEAKKIYEAK